MKRKRNLTAREIAALKQAGGKIYKVVCSNNNNKGEATATATALKYICDKIYYILEASEEAKRSGKSINEIILYKYDFLL